MAERLGAASGAGPGGTFNFRDLGGTAVAGGRLRPRQLFRSDEPGRRTTAGLDEVGLRTIVDLRSSWERADRPPCAAKLGIGDWAVPVLGDLPEGRLPPAAVSPERVAAYYLSIVERSTGQLGELLLHLPTALPALLHCSLGKDRTGVVVALVLGLLGAEREVIVADYERSRQAAQMLVDRVPRASSIRGIQGMCELDGRSMTMFLDELHARHGDFEDLSFHLGAADAVAPLRAALIERP